MNSPEKIREYAGMVHAQASRLTSLVEQAISRNHDLRASAARVAQARAQAATSTIQNNQAGVTAAQANLAVLKAQQDDALVPLGQRVQQLAEEAPVFREGRCLPYGSGVVYWALSEVLRADAGMRTSVLTHMAWVPAEWEQALDVYAKALPSLADKSRAENNVVHDVSYNAGDSAGIRTSGGGHVVTGNTVYNTGRSGMKLSNSTALKITNNLVHDAMLQTTDGGGIYTFGMDGTGSEIAYNRIYNITSGGFGGVGIFLDNNSVNWLIHHNVIWNTTHALKMNYAATGNRVLNNTLAGIGIHFPKHRKRAIAIGEKLGIFRDYPVSKGCTSPFAPIWINAMVSRQG